MVNMHLRAVKPKDISKAFQLRSVTPALIYPLPPAMASSSSSSVDKTHLPPMETMADQFCSLAKLQKKRWADNPTWEEEQEMAWEAEQEMERWGHALWEKGKLAQDSSVQAGQVQAEHAWMRDLFLTRVSC